VRAGLLDLLDESQHRRFVRGRRRPLRPAIGPQSMEIESQPSTLGEACAEYGIDVKDLARRQAQLPFNGAVAPPFHCLRPRCRNEKTTGRHATAAQPAWPCVSGSAERLDENPATGVPDPTSKISTRNWPASSREHGSDLRSASENFPGGDHAKPPGGESAYQREHDIRTRGQQRPLFE
jgi:hypothetical protein